MLLHHIISGFTSFTSINQYVYIYIYTYIWLYIHIYITYTIITIYTNWIKLMFLNIEYPKTHVFPLKWSGVGDSGSPHVKKRPCDRWWICIYVCHIPIIETLTWQETVGGTPPHIGGSVHPGLDLWLMFFPTWNLDTPPPFKVEPYCFNFQMGP